MRHLFKRTLSTLLVAAILSGCNTTPTIDPNYTAYVEAVKAQQANQKPEVQLLRIKAKPGETITLGGVEELVVNMPSNNSGGGSIQLQQRVQQPSETLQALGLIMPVVGAVGGIWAGGIAAKNLVTAVGASNQAIANSGFSAVSTSSGASNANLTTVVNGMNTLGTAGITGVKDTATAALTSNQTIAGQGFTHATTASNNLTTLGQSGITGVQTTANYGITGMTTLGQSGMTNLTTLGTAGITNLTTLGQSSITGVQTTANTAITNLNTLGAAGITGVQSTATAIGQSAITGLGTVPKVCTVDAAGVLTCK